MLRLSTFAFLALSAPAAVQACSCMGNSSYCETLSPSWFLNPDATALVVKLSDIHYGITVKVVATYGGTSLPDDTLTVWGDNGGLCRNYLNGIADGDTVVMGMNETDFAGNTMWNPDYPPDLEMAGDYMVSVCGVHMFDFQNNMVHGWITAPELQHMSIAEFEAAIAPCAIGTGIADEDELPGLTVRYLGDVPQLELPGCNGRVVMNLVDAQGRTVLSRDWDGLPLALTGLSSGAYIAEVRHNGSRAARKLIVP